MRHSGAVVKRPTYEQWWEQQAERAELPEPPNVSGGDVVDWMARELSAGTLRRRKSTWTDDGRLQSLGPASELGAFGFGYSLARLPDWWMHAATPIPHGGTTGVAVVFGQVFQRLLASKGLVEWMDRVFLRPTNVVLKPLRLAWQHESLRPVRGRVRSYLIEPVEGSVAVARFAFGSNPGRIAFGAASGVAIGVLFGGPLLLLVSAGALFRWGFPYLDDRFHVHEYMEMAMAAVAGGAKKTFAFARKTGRQLVRRSERRVESSWNGSKMVTSHEGSHELELGEPDKRFFRRLSAGEALALADLLLLGEQPGLAERFGLARRLQQFVRHGATVDDALGGGTSTPGLIHKLGYVLGTGSSPGEFGAESSLHVVGGEGEGSHAIADALIKAHTSITIKNKVQRLSEAGIGSARIIEVLEAMSDLLSSEMQSAATLAERAVRRRGDDRSFERALTVVVKALEQLEVDGSAEALFERLVEKGFDRDLLEAIDSARPRPPVQGLDLGPFVQRDAHQLAYAVVGMRAYDLLGVRGVSDHTAHARSSSENMALRPVLSHRSQQAAFSHEELGESIIRGGGIRWGDDSQRVSSAALLATELAGGIESSPRSQELQSELFEVIVNCRLESEGLVPLPGTEPILARLLSERGPDASGGASSGMSETVSRVARAAFGDNVLRRIAENAGEAGAVDTLRSELSRRARQIVVNANQAEQSKRRMSERSTLRSDGGSSVTSGDLATGATGATGADLASDLLSSFDERPESVRVALVAALEDARRVPTGRRAIQMLGPSAQRFADALVTNGIDPCEVVTGNLTGPSQKALDGALSSGRSKMIGNALHRAGARHTQRGMVVPQDQLAALAHTLSHAGVRADELATHRLQPSTADALRDALTDAANTGCRRQAATVEPAKTPDPVATALA